jgi:hypothetical protein
MTLIMGDLRAALVNAGASEELATRAASKVATYEGRLASIDTRLSVLAWMAGGSLTLALLTLGGVLSIWEKLGEVTGTLAQITQHLR